MPVLVSLLAAEVAPPTAVGDVAELLHVHVQQRTGVVVFVAADRFAGTPVDVPEPVEPAADQHRVHGRGGQPEPGGDRDRPQPMPPPQVHDRPHHRLRRPRRRAVRTRGPVRHPGLAGLPVALRPPRRGRPRHVVALRRPSHRPAVVHDKPSEPKTRPRGQRSVSVGHEDLPVVMRMPSAAPHHARRSSPHQDHSDRVVTRPTSPGSTARSWAAPPAAAPCSPCRWPSAAARRRTSPPPAA